MGIHQRAIAGIQNQGDDGFCRTPWVQQIDNQLAWGDPY